MSKWAEFVAALALFAIAATCFAGTGLVLKDSSSPGCHSHLKAGSSLQKLDFACCQSGHDVALATSTTTFAPADGCQFDLAVVVEFSSRQFPAISLLRFSGGPPLSAPLLI